MDVRDRLVHAGVELLEADGLEALTLRKIATSVGVSHGAPRHHFPTFAGLLAAIARVGVDDLDAIIRNGLQIPDARAALSTAGTGVVGFAIKRPAMFELIGRHDVLDGAGGQLREVTGEWLPLVLARLRELADDVDHRHALALWAGVHGLATMLSRRSAQAISTRPVVPTEVLAVLVDGIVPAHRPASAPDSA